MTAEERGYPPKSWQGSLIGVVGTRGVGCTLLAECLAEDLSCDASNRGLVARVTGTTSVADLDNLKASHRFVIADIGSAATSAAITSAAAALAVAAPVGSDSADSNSAGSDSAGSGAVASNRADTATSSISATAVTAAMLSRCDLIAMVANPNTESLNWLARTSEALATMMDIERLVTVINRLPRNFRHRSAAVKMSLRQLADSSALAAGAPVLINESRAPRRATGRAALGDPAASAALTQMLSNETRQRLASLL